MVLHHRDDITKTINHYWLWASASLARAMIRASTVARVMVRAVHRVMARGMESNYDPDVIMVI